MDFSPMPTISKGYFTNKAKLTSPVARARNSLVGFIVLVVYVVTRILFVVNSWIIYGNLCSKRRKHEFPLIAHELVMNYFCLFPQYLLQRAHHLA